MIELKNIVKDYDNGKCCTHALRGVNLKIEKGELVSIVGTSGSGKSTLLNILGGMDSATSGEYMYNGELVSSYDFIKLQCFRKENISFVFQNFALMNQYTVYENVEMPLLARRIKKRKEIVRRCLENVGIMELANKYPTQISGGQQQRCAIARALAANTQLILADEPTGALDKATAEEIIDCFIEMNKMGKTVIIITHDLNIAKRCNKIIHIEDGILVEE